MVISDLIIESYILNRLVAPKRLCAFLFTFSNLLFRTALARWRAAYVDKINEIKKRPHFAGDCEILKDAMYFRRQVVHEISRKIAQIQNRTFSHSLLTVFILASLGEYKLRDLNDEINKLIREKDRWDVRIKELGGPDYREDGPKLLEKDGREAPGNRGYRYFGAARDLPGVRELFEEQRMLFVSFPHPFKINPKCNLLFPYSSANTP